MHIKSMFHNSEMYLFNFWWSHTFQLPAEMQNVPKLILKIVMAGPYQYHLQLL